MQNEGTLLEAGRTMVRTLAPLSGVKERILVVETGVVYDLIATAKGDGPAITMRHANMQSVWEGEAALALWGYLCECSILLAPDSYITTDHA